MLPSKFGWSGVFIGRPKLEAWWNAISADADAQRVSFVWHFFGDILGTQTWRYMSDYHPKY